MKLRIKGNSVRIRVNKLEVGKLSDTGYLQEDVLFAGNKFVYALHSTESGHELSAVLDSNKMTMLVPKELIQNWPHNNIVGFEAKMPVGKNDVLYLLLEKDFACLDDTEAKSDYYENPNKIC